MKMTYFTIIRINLFVLIGIIGSTESFAQYREGKIIFQRKTNLYKRFGNEAKNWIKEKDKIKVEFFELTFTDSLSAWKEIPNDIPFPE